MNMPFSEYCKKTFKILSYPLLVPNEDIVSSSSFDLLRSTTFENQWLFLRTIKN